MISTHELLRLRLRAQDGDAGSVTDLVFNDCDWTVREFIVETGGWLFGRSVSIDPDAVGDPDLVNGVLPLEMTKEDLKDAPDGIAKSPGEDPVSEDILSWNESNALASVPGTVLLAGATVPAQPLVTHTPPPSLHMRSLSEFDGYTVLAGDEEVGKFAGFLVDPIAWDLPMALVELDGPEAVTVLLPTRLIVDLGWPERVVKTYLDPETLRSAPAYDARVLDERVYLPAVADHYSTRV